MMDLKFQFESLIDFWQMAGHGPYVWACYALTFTSLGLLLWAPLRRRRALFEQLRRQQRITEHEQQLKSQSAG